MTNRTIIGSAYWASYLINGDASGLTDKEIALCDAWYDNEVKPDETIVDCGEPYFSWSYGLHTGDTVSGGDVVEYNVLS